MHDFVTVVIAVWPALVVLAAFTVIGLALDHTYQARWENDR